MSDAELHITSGVAAETGKPYCHVTWGAQEGHLTPAEVRMMALAWLGAAEAAETDAMMVRMLREDAELPDEAIGGMLVRMRGLREEWRATT